MKSKMLVLIIAAAAASCSAPSKTAIKDTPVAERRTHLTVINGDTISDEFFYMRNREDKAVMEYIESENSYTEESMKHTLKLQNKLYDEFLARIEESDSSYPSIIDSFEYYDRTAKGKNYGEYCRKRRGSKEKPEVILNADSLAMGKAFFDISIFKPSPDHRTLMFAADCSGAEKYTLYFMDIESGKVKSDSIADVTSAEWLNSGKSVYYTIENGESRSYMMKMHLLGDEPRNDIPVYEEPDSRFSVYLSKTRDRRYIITDISSNISSEVMYGDADSADCSLSMLFMRKHGVEYYVDEADGYFYVMDNDNTPNFRLYRMKPGDSKNIEVILKGDDEKTITGFDVFKGYIAIYRRENGVGKILIYDRADRSIRQVEFDEPFYAVYPHSNYTFDSESLRLSYTSLTTPFREMSCSMKDLSLTLLKEQKVKGGYNRDDYATEYVFAKADDGVMIPISMVYRKSMKRAEGNPLLLEGYGAYGSSSDPYFASSYVSLLDRGIILATAHVRGGGDLGRKWYEDGKLLKKKNSFTDFVKCADYLYENGYAYKGGIIIKGASAGGLLIGAVLNIAGPIFNAAILDVPFVDVLNTMLDSTIPLTVGEFDEWGNPREPLYYEYMKSYSPYDNIEAKDYPAMLVTGGLNDSRVAYWEPVKYTAKMRMMKTDKNPLYLKINMNAGHSGDSGRYTYYRDNAFKFAFILDRFRITK